MDPRAASAGRPWLVLAVLTIGACHSSAPPAEGAPSPARPGHDAGSDRPEAPTDAGLVSGPDAIGWDAIAPAVDAAEPPLAFQPTDGQRLKISWAVEPGGRRFIFGLTDTLLHVPCSFRLAADGETRCLPFGPSRGTTFADAACTQPAVIFDADACGPSAYIRTTDSIHPCGKREHIFKRGAQADGIFSGASVTSMATCKPSALLPGEAIYLVGDEVPPESFVKGTDVPVGQNADGGIVITARMGEDGSRTDTGWLDPRSNSKCTWYPGPDQDSFSCLPASPAISSGTFADGACGTKTASSTTACGPTPTLMAQSQAGTCPRSYKLFALGPKLPQVYTKASGICAASPAPAGSDYEAVGALVAWSSVPGLSYKNEPGEAPLRKRYIVLPDGNATLASAWYDSRRQETCTPVAFAGGKTRCAPSFSTVYGYYADAACTQPLWRGVGDTCPPKYAATWTTTTCPTSYVLYSVGARHAGPSYVLYTIRGDGLASLECQPNDEDPDPNEFFHDLTPVADDQLAEVAVQTAK